jgi:hypothetical protein
VLLDDGRAGSLDEDQFFHHLRLPNGTYKTTAHGRLTALDRWLVSKLVEPDVSLLDVAVSSGVTTVELLEAMDSAGIRVNATVCDLCIHARIRHLALGLEVLIDSQGYILQVASRLGVKGRPHDPRGSVRRLGLASVFRLLEAACRVTENLPRESDIPVQLLSRRLRQRADVLVFEQDIFERREDWVGRFSVVRAANILNRDYFNESRLIQGIQNLQSYLQLGGFLLVGRTDEESETNASLLQLTPAGLVLIDRFGTGSEVELLALSTAHHAA